MKKMLFGGEKWKKQRNIESERNGNQGGSRKTVAGECLGFYNIKCVYVWG